MTHLRDRWEARFLLYETLLALVLGTAFIVWQERYGGSRAVYDVLHQNQGLFYGTLATILGALLGLAIATVSIVLVLTQSDRLAVLRESEHYPTLWRVYTSTVRWLGVGTVAALAALLLDTDARPCPAIRDALVPLVLILTERVARAIWALEWLIRVSAAPAGE